MRAVVQRVTQAAVQVDDRISGQIRQGLLVYLGVGPADDEAAAQYIADKLVHLRIFSDEQGKMNRSIQDVGGAVLLISQFTLYGDCRKGRRPGFDQAAEPALAQRLYEHVAELIRQAGLDCPTGVFAAHMADTSTNDGPVTFLLDSARSF